MDSSSEQTFFNRPETLPEPLRRLTLIGTDGRFQLLGLAQQALESNDEQVVVLGVDFLLAAFEHDPLDGAIAGQILHVVQNSPLVSDGVKDLLRATVEAAGETPDTRYLGRLKLAGDMDAVRNYIEERLAGGQGALHWLKEAVALGAYRGEWDWVRGMVGGYAGHAPGWALAKLRGDMAMLAGDCDAAMEAYAESLNTVETALVFARLGEAMRRTGKKDEAHAAWVRSLSMRPWQVNLLMRLHDSILTQPGVSNILDGGLAVLLYTHNKADDLDATLATLAASDAIASSASAESCIIRVLDNGSTDGTADVLNKWEDTFGSDRFGVVRLPVNVGAPAARNWLLSLDDVRTCKYVAYLDDDAHVPPDWLDGLASAVARYPNAGVWGCKVVDAANPAVLQSVDHHLADPPPKAAQPDPESLDYQRRFKVSNLQHQDLDFGQFDYCRPCHSVTGCCHLFLRERLEESGLFDIRFSPTQYDDIEHDMRQCKDGLFPVYQGRLGVHHAKRSGSQSRTDPKATAGAMANLYKLQMLYSKDEITAMRARLTDALAEDLAAKRQALVNAGVLE
ncbi:glycosyltransferase family 2 protein [Oceanidesulfovibrio indonesiensis]|uniref:glycosyltransferase family 2 protein n=1 Tax=Oceanidesulfovibrio indonesiensis TaxID=54767 RepID=UPI001430D54F|nr:glycosyltransferase [Oceanidesulfovibrio indonesiensis]